VFLAWCLAVIPFVLGSGREPVTAYQRVSLHQRHIWDVSDAPPQSMVALDSSLASSAIGLAWTDKLTASTSARVEMELRVYMIVVESIGTDR
jgi:hypothetical protein